MLDISKKRNDSVPNASIENRAAEALLRSVRDDGTEWQFLALAHGWAITRNRIEVAVGTSDPASILIGVVQFKSLTAKSHVAAACDPGVAEQLDRIEAVNAVRGAARSQKPKKSRVMTKASAPFSFVPRRPVRCA